MSKLRPARSVRGIYSQAWARYSVKKPKKNYIKSLPHTSLIVFNMGQNRPTYDTLYTLNSDQDVQLRSNALEASRQVANKHLERELVNNYYFTVVTYPHNVIREKKRATGAGADRLSQGMSLSFGSPSSICARVKKGQVILKLRTFASSKAVAKAALKRAASKLSGTYTINTYPIKAAA